jgi:hypothetical protein
MRPSTLFFGLLRASWLASVAPNFRGDGGALVHTRVAPLRWPIYSRIFRTRGLNAELSALISLENNVASKLEFLRQLYVESASQPSTGHGRAKYSFLCAMLLGFTASSALSPYVLVCYVPSDKIKPTLPVSLNHLPSRRPVQRRERRRMAMVPQVREDS